MANPAPLGLPVVEEAPKSSGLNTERICVLQVNSKSVQIARETVLENPSDSLSQLERGGFEGAESCFGN